MRRYLFIIFLFFIVMLLFADSARANHNRPNCLGMYGTVQGVNYSGGQIKVSCGGDAGPSGCTGNSAMLSPGQSFHFDNCSCPPYTDGCLKVENVPWLCSAGYDMACGTNGQVLRKDITLSCLLPPSASPTSTPTPVPIPPSNLGVEAVCLASGTPQVKFTWRPGESPSLWLDITKEQSFGLNFYNRDVTDNSNAGIFYWDTLRKIKLNTSNTNDYAPEINTTYNWRLNYGPASVNGQSFTTPATCVPSTTISPTESPTPTPTGTPTPTPTPSIVPSGPPVTLPPLTPPVTPPVTSTPRPSATFTPKPPTPTPTPDLFSPAMCKCDGMEATGIFPGANVSFSAFAKVFGTDVNFAKVKDITFSVYESPENKPNTAIRIAQSSPISAQEILKDSSAIRYKSNWNFIFPANVNTSSLYRVTAQINCVKKVAMAPSNVLGEETVRPSFIQNLLSFLRKPLDFVGGLFGGGDSELLSESPSELAVPTQTTNQRTGLQLKTIQPAQMLEKSCSLLKFKFNNQ